MYFKYEYDNICYNSYPKSTQIISEFFSESILTEIPNEIPNERPNEIHIINQTHFDSVKGKFLLNYNSDKSTQIEGDNILITLDTVEDEKENLSKNKTSINLGECDTKLKKAYNISFNNSLYILKIEVKDDYINIPKIEYEVYYPLDNKNLFLLNLSFCESTEIEITIPVSINNDIDKYNSSSGYYNDICSKATSDFGTDISLSDRKDEFINKNLTLCEEDCKLIDYNYTTEKAKCSCLVKIHLPLIDDIKFDKNKLYNNFKDIVNLANIKLLNCYKTVFDLINLKKNYGFFILVFAHILLFLCFFLFYFKFYSSLQLEIQAIEQAKKEKFKNKKSNKKDLNTMITNNKNKKKKKNKSIRITKPNYPPGKNKPKKTIINKNKIIKKKSNLSSLINNINPHNTINKKTQNITKDKKEPKNKDVLKYSDIELNSLLYKKALKHDERKYFEYYISLLKSNHLLIFAFYSDNKDYNSQIIKIFLFFFSFTVELTVNALFFREETIHKIYLDEGEFNFIYQLPQIFYSSIISIVITSLMKYLALSRKIILEIKYAKTKNILNEKIKVNIPILKIKFALFFIIAFILLSFYLYYITCFCGVYVNTQIHVIKDTLISFGLSLVYPFGTCLIPGIFRMKALQNKKKDKEYLYKFSQFIQQLL